MASHPESNVKSLSASSISWQPIERVLIVGAGWTGRQIAGQMVAHGLHVTLIDSNHHATKISLDWVESQRLSFFEQGFWPNLSSDQLLERLSVAASLDGLLDSKRIF